MINAVSSNPSSTTNPVPLPDATSSVPPVMPQQPTMDMNSSTPPGPTHKPKRRKSSISPKMVLGSLFLLLLIVGGVSAFVLSNQSQDTRNQAWIDPGIPTNPPYKKSCETGGTYCPPGKTCDQRNRVCKTAPTSTPKSCETGGTYCPSGKTCDQRNRVCKDDCNSATHNCTTSNMTRWRTK